MTDAGVFQVAVKAFKPFSAIKGKKYLSDEKC